jgi:phosphoglycolate phosphatase
MHFKAVIFDIDGTLLDTLLDIANSANTVLARSGFPQHKPQDYKYYVGDGIQVLAQRILPTDRRDETTINKIAAEIDSEYSQHWADNSHPYPGIPELLQSLTDRGIKIAALSNKPDRSARLTVSRLLPDWHFEFVLGVSPSIPKKPDPQGALGIAQSLKIKPDDFVYLGDTDTDMKTAGSAGMYAVGALWGFRTAEELLASGARLLLHSPLELLKIL